MTNHPNRSRRLATDALIVLQNAGYNVARKDDELIVEHPRNPGVYTRLAIAGGTVNNHDVKRIMS
jgi:hypothetical protein